ncbi:MAG: TfoX/Sxy family protein [Sulfitobacter sp.]|nr:TfoX/Sxy family protein [Sulfitobacter sp.]
MSLGAGDMDFARELFSDIPDLTTRRMFGGMGLYCGGTIFALMMSDGRILLKAAKGPFADRMAQLGGNEWTYTHKTGAQAACPTGPCPMPIWTTQRPPVHWPATRWMRCAKA